MTAPTRVAVIGSGNIGTDLVVKVMRSPGVLEMAALVGIDPESDGLARARRIGVATTSDGVEGLIAMPEFQDVRIVFDATSARAHVHNARALQPHGRRLIDLTPAALGPLVVPVVNLQDHLDAPDVNMVTCGGQATIPVVAAVSDVTPVFYAEIVATISSRSAGPGTRDNIDEFTQTTARALEVVGRAERGKAIIILNPADPPILMRDTVHALVAADADRGRISDSVHRQVAAVARYVPGYRLKQDVQFQQVPAGSVRTLVGDHRSGAALTQVSVFLEVEGAADYLPAYAGNLDIMTSAALRVGETIADRLTAVPA